MSKPSSSAPPAAPRTGGLAWLLAALAMIGPFSISTYLPSFPALQVELGASPLQMQQTLSVYLVGFAVMTLVHGTVSDSFGRKPVVLANLAVFSAASVGCALAVTFEQMLVFRGIQGLSAGAGIVVGRAIIRDTVQGEAAQRLMSLVTMLFGLAPAVAPVLGGWLQSAFGWQSVFVFLTVYAAVLLAACSARLAESLPQAQRQPFELEPLARNYRKLGRSLPLFFLSSAIALNFCGFFLYIAASPSFVYQVLGLGETDFVWLFVPAVAGVTLGAFVSGRLAGKRSPRATVKIAYAIIFGAVAFNLAYSAFAPPRLPWSVLPIMIYATGMSLAMPSLTLMALDLFPHNRGLASSLLGFQHSLFSAIVAGVLAPLIAHAALTLAVGMGVTALAGAIFWCAYLRRSRRDS